MFYLCRRTGLWVIDLVFGLPKVVEALGINRTKGNGGTTVLRRSIGMKEQKMPSFAV